MTAAEYKAKQETRKRASYKAITFNPEFEFHREHLRWVENASKGLRVVGKCHEIARNEGYGSWRDYPTGWYVDMYQQETVSGVVIALPGHDRHPVYVPAVEDAYNNDSYVVNFRDVTDDLRDATSWANSLAEHWAEQAREDDMKYRAETRIEDAKSEIETVKAETRSIVRELKGHCEQLTGLKETKRIVRKHIKAARNRIRTLRREIERLTSEPWTIDAGRNW